MLIDIVVCSRVRAIVCVCVSAFPFAITGNGFSHLFEMSLRLNCTCIRLEMVLLRRFEQNQENTCKSADYTVDALPEH